MSIYYDRESSGSGRYYWYCYECDQYGYETRIDFVYTAGKTHKAVKHGR